MSYYNKKYTKVEYVAKSSGQGDVPEENKGEYSTNKEPKYDNYGNKGGHYKNKKPSDKANFPEDGYNTKSYKKNNDRRGYNQDGQSYQDPQGEQNNQFPQQNDRNSQNKKNYGGYRGQNSNQGDYYQEQDTYQKEERRGESRRGRGNRRGGPRNQRGPGRDDDTQLKPEEEKEVQKPEQGNASQGSEEGEKSEGSSDGEHETEDFSNVPVSELAEILKDRFLKNHIDCPICFNKIRKEAKMWSCKQCYGPFHLGCIQKWINKNPANLKDGKPIPNLKYYSWACPKCNYNYTEEYPEYKCFCAKEINPEFDPYNIPHSCGSTCGKKKGHNCTHPCALGCHPGPCPPCRAFGQEQSCFCGGKRMRMRCGEESGGFACGDVCNKVLNCGKHNCTEKCHPGACEKCQVKNQAQCFCGKKEEVRDCGDEAFSCKQVCGKKLDCGNHTCKAICHSGPCEDCKYTPEKMEKCCCGRMSAMALGADNRKSCLDPIPICGLPCSKKMACGHNCKKMCHPYECGPCKEIVVQYCRCGKSDRKIECWKTTNGEEEDRVFMCDRVCKKAKSCRNHKCQRVCCEASKGNDPEGHHLCLKVCNKPLNCGKHNCGDFCHLGGCKQCPVIINYPLACTCGKTVKFPPMQCGTSKPDCSHPCSRERPCGHPCYLKCHYDNCPPCEEHVTKFCRCGKKEMKNMRCSREALCGVPCDIKLPCGHKCGIVCHEGPCDMERGVKGCGAKCKKIKEKCGHPCEALCHPEQPCPDLKCKVQVKIKCECGNRETLINCGDRDTSKLECDKTCANMKRFGAFLKRDSDKKPYYPAFLVRFAKNNLSYLLKIETKIEKMVKEGNEMMDIPVFDNISSKKGPLYQLLSKHYGLDLEFFLHVKNPSIILRWTKDSKLPNPLLSEYLKQIESGKIRPEILPFEASLRCYNISIHDSIEELERNLKDYQDEFYIERSDRHVMVHFWKKDVAESALKTLRKSTSNFASVVLEENLDLKAEEEKIAAIDSDIKPANQENETGNEEENKNAEVLKALNK